MDLILDVKEKEVGQVKPPTLPSLTSGTTGFPEHKKRSRPSAFKQKRQQAAEGASLTPKTPEPRPQGAVSQNKLAPQSSEPEDAERRRIDRENRQKLQSMSKGEIEEAQQELLGELDPSILQMLLRRANLDDTGDAPKQLSASSGERPKPATVDDEAPVAPTQSENKRPETKPKVSKKVTFDEDAAPSQIPDNLFPISSQPPATDTAHKHDHNHDQDHDHDHDHSTHFPSHAQAPDLDPQDPDFLANLHAKYFPQLPSDPTKLAWMAPLPTPNSIADKESPYHPEQSSLPVSALRFDFKGRLVPPSVARSIPSTMGLHHHAEAPEAAGYTITELARFCRSSVPAQRCIAFQTMGRILFRLGKGEWGIGEGGRVGEEDDLAFSIWRLIKSGKVIESLEEAASVPEGVGHRGARAYAIEALWLAEKGGWKERWRGM